MSKEKKKKIIVSSQLRLPRGLLDRLDAYLEKHNAEREVEGYKAQSRNSFCVEAIEARLYDMGSSADRSA